MLSMLLFFHGRAIKFIAVVFAICFATAGFLFSLNSAYAVTDTYTSSGTWTAPAGVTSVTAEVWGGGGAGGGQNQNSDGGGGGGGGAYSIKSAITVIPGNNYTITVGTGGLGVASSCGGGGGDSWFVNTATILAKGGIGGCPSTGTPPQGGLGGSSASGVGGTKFSGGQGEAGRNNNNGIGGYGGSSAGTATNGWSGPQTHSTNIYPTASTPTGAGHGGNGGTAGNNGSLPVSGYGGGGGGSGDGTARAGGAGYGGKIVLIYTPNTAPTLSVTQPDGAGDTVTVGDLYNITYSLSDAEQVVTADFYYDTNNSGLDGTLITGCQNQVAGVGATCSWNTTGVTPGSYYVYGRDVSDGIAPEVSTYSSGTITINAPPASGTVSASPSSCTISSGASACTVPFTWSITNATLPNLYNASTPNQYSTSASGSGVSYQITNGSNIVQVRDNGTVLNSTTATGSCEVGTSWNGSICAVVVNYYTIFASSGTNGTVEPTGTTTVAQNGSQIYAITPNPSYDVETLLVDGGSVATSTSYTFTNVQASHTIYATFVLLPSPPVTHTITSSAGSNGTIVPLGATIVADHGSQGYTIAPDSGFTIETLVVDSVSIATSTSYAFTDVTADHTIAATFALIPPPPGSFTIIATSGANGTVLPGGSTVVAEHGSQAYTITPDPGYDVGTLIIDSFTVATSTSYTFTDVQADHTIEATFVALTTPEIPIIRSVKRLASVTFSGKAFPGGKISIIQKDLATEEITEVKDVTGADGSFQIRFIDLHDGVRSFGLLIKDPEGRTSQTKFFLIEAIRGDEIFKNIVTPPTIDVMNGQVSRGGNIKVFGYASPGHTIRVYINDILSKEVLAGRGGVYSFDLPTGALPFGQHKVRTKQINLDGGTESDFSTTRTVIVSKLSVVKADLSGDGKVDIKDWSIFLARWGSKSSLGRAGIDLSGDGKIDISDFSIFIKTIRKK